MVSSISCFHFSVLQEAPRVKGQFCIDYSRIPGGTDAFVMSAPNVIDVDYSDESLALPAPP